MQRCKHDAECGWICLHHRKPCRQPCSRTYEPARAFKAFGWEVTVQFQNFTTVQFHWRGVTEGGARRKGMLKPLAVRILKVEPVDEVSWIRAYGIGSEHGGG